MSDTQMEASPSKKGFGKFGMTGFALELAQHTAPLLTKYLQSRYGLDDWWANEITYGSFTVIGSFAVLATPSNFVRFVTDCILFSRRALRTWHDAWFSPQP